MLRLLPGSGRGSGLRRMSGGSAEPDHVVGDVIDPQTQPALPQRETVPEQMAVSTGQPEEAAGSLEDEFFNQ